MNGNFIVRGLTANGHELFYTGRAGEGWVSPAKSESFEYLTLEGARNKALIFNRSTALHGIHFIGMALTPAEVA